jgi:BirA family biotin operon repressor/biotin-[acetyl-CoA-carboxylase] ligase
VDELDVRHLPRETFVRQIRALDETESTNTVALGWSAQLLPQELPALVITERQTAGRGRGANRWWSGPGGLTFSLLLEPARHGLPASRWPALSLAVGGAIATAMEREAPRSDVRLKWPNDVFVNGRKVGGVLIETPPTTAQRLVVGVGLNVNNSLAEAPDDVRQRAIALCDVHGRTFDRNDLLVRLLQQLQVDLEALASSAPSLLTRWRKLCLLTGRSVVITDSGRTIAGTCLGIDDDGALRVQTGSSVERLFSGVVTDFG